MKLQLDTQNKTIKIEGNVKLSELFEHLYKLLPEDSQFGYWKDYTLETNVTINNWNYPIIIRNYTNPWWNQNPYAPIGQLAPSYTTTGTTTSVYNLKLN